MALLERLQQNMGLLVDACPMALLVESDGIVVFGNKAALDLLGCESIDSLVGLPFTELIPSLAEAEADEAPGARAGVVETLKGKRVRVAVTSKPLPMDGTPARAVFLQALDRGRKELGSTDVQEHIGEVFMKLRRLGHEMNQPLTVISGKIQLIMLDLDESEPLYKDIKAINDAVFRTGDIVRTMSQLIKSVQDESERLSR